MTPRDQVPPAIAAEALTKRYRGRTALDGISLAVPPGSVLALLGPNGAGKTTLVRILTTLVRPDGGRASVAGHDVVAEATRVRRAIGLVGQHAAVDEYLTGRENLVLVARLLRFDRGAAQRRASAALETFGLGDAADVPVTAYSGGMRRRLDLAVTLLGDPAVIFLDEPTTGLDPESRQRLWALVDQLVAGGTTVLLTTQYLEEADRLASTVAVIDHGRLIASGSPDELKARLGGDTVRIRLADPGDVAAATGALGGGATLATPGPGHPTVDLRTPDGAACLPELLRRLQDRGVSVTAAEVRRPSLDDVFLALTGRGSGAAATSDPHGGAPAGGHPGDPGKPRRHRHQHARSHR